MNHILRVTIIFVLQESILHTQIIKHGS